MSDYHKSAANSVDSSHDTLAGKLLLSSQAETQRSKLCSERIEAIKAEVADAGILRSKMIDAMRRKLEAQARLQSAGEEASSIKAVSEDSAEPADPTLIAESPALVSSDAEDSAAPPSPPPAKVTKQEPALAIAKDIDIDSIFVPEAEANRRPAPPPLKTPSNFPEAWDEAFQSAQRVENALARLQEALQRDERHARRARHRASKASRSRRPRPLRVATLFMASFMIGISAVVFAYDWHSPISFESRLAEFGREFLPIEKLKFANQSTPAPAKSVEQPLTATPVQKTKKLALVRLEASDTEGRAGTDIPLIIKTIGGAGPVDLRIVGVPDGVSLSTGKRAKDGSWLLTTPEQSKTALRVPVEVSGKLQLMLEAVDRKSGELATPPQEIAVNITPANVVLESTASPVTSVVQLREVSSEVASAKEVPLAEAPPEEVELAAVEEAEEAPAMAVGITDPSRPLIARGDALMELGDVVAARHFYDRAFEMGNLRAARSIARTYDPVVLGSMRVQGLRSDPVKALDWYRKAEKAGESDATQAIAALETFLGQ